jgi:DNA-binding SARP family transcriptional activator
MGRITRSPVSNARLQSDSLATIAGMSPRRDEDFRLREAVSRIQLLNVFALICEGEAVALPMPAQRLLAFLALQERPVLRVHAAGMLWLDYPEDRAFGSLRSALWRVRRAGRGLIEATRDQLRLASHVTVDVREVMACAQRIFDASTQLETSDQDRISRAGELLPDWYDDWVVIERERLRFIRVHALETLCDRLAAAAMFAPATEAGLAAVSAEPLRESAHRALIKVHLAQGNTAEAVHQYRRFRRLLRDELNLEPSDQIKQLVRSSISVTNR